jgi:hypothetical protein
LLINVSSEFDVKKLELVCAFMMVPLNKLNRQMIETNITTNLNLVIYD